MKKKITISLMISTYNRPEVLGLCVRSVFHQNLLPNEIIIGDDGSKEETRLLIEELKKESPIPIIHVWQEDHGFRVAKIRNKAIVKCSSEYIIQIDGDIVLHKSFIEDHIKFSKKGYFLKGSRVNFTKKKTKVLCEKQKIPIVNFFSQGIRKRLNSIHNLTLAILVSPIYRRYGTFCMGCNTSFWKEDFMKINGYDEFYEGWGGEDYDFGFRLVNSGVKRFYLKFSGVAYHLWHEHEHMYNKEKNVSYYNEMVKKKKAKCDVGANQYL